MDFREWQEQQRKQRQVETKDETSFFARKGELEELETFLSDRKNQIFCLYGVPMIGKTTLVRQFLKSAKNNDFEIQTIQFLNPENPEITLNNKLAEIDWKNELPKLIIVENFEESLQWKGDKNHLHEIKFPMVAKFLKYVSEVPHIKVILESRFQIKLDFLPKIYTNIELGKIDRRDLYINLNNLYRNNSVSFETFEKVCEKFDDHVWLIEMAMQDNWHFQYVQETINHSKSITQKLWDKLQDIIKKLPSSQKTLLCAFSVINPIPESDLERELGKLPMFQRDGEIDNAIFSLRKKLLAIYNIQNNSFEINPFLREVCFTFLKKQREMRNLETLPYFNEAPKPKFDAVRQAREKGEYKTFFNLIKEKRRKGQYKEVIEILEETYWLDSNKVGVLNEIAITYKWQKNYDEAIKTLNKALKINSNDVKTLNELAIVYKEQKNRDEAIKTLNKALKINSNDVKTLNELAIVYKEQKNRDEAIKIFSDLIEKYKHIPAYNELAIIYKKQKNYDEAIKVLNKALEIEPDNVKVLNELAIIYKEQKNYDEAIKTLNKALKINSNDVKTLNELAIVYKEQKNRDEAIKIFSDLIEKHKHLPAYNGLAIIYKEEKNYDEAIKILNEGLKIAPDDMFFKSTLRRVHQEKDRYKIQSINDVKDMEQIKRNILFVAANPKDEARLQTDKEHRIIKTEMDRGTHRENFEFLQPQLAVTITELLRAFDQKPQIIHFSGHGAEEGIVITKDDNTSQLLNNAIMERLFKNLRGITEVVVLNSCYSASQAEAISKFGMYVVGNTEPIDDDVAISFAKGLYVGLSQGKSFEDAMNDALIVVMTESSNDSADIIEAWKNGIKLSI